MAATQQALDAVLAGAPRDGARSGTGPEHQHVRGLASTNAARYDLHKVSDLAPVARQLNFGGPPECPTRPLCLEGLEDTYDLRFRRRAGPRRRRTAHPPGPRDGFVDVGLLFSTDPDLTDRSLLALDDDRHLQPAENVTPLVRTEVLDRWGAPLRATLDAVSARLTTAELRQLNAQVGLRPATERRRAAAARGSAAQGLR